MGCQTKLLRVRHIAFSFSRFLSTFSSIKRNPWSHILPKDFSDNFESHYFLLFSVHFFMPQLFWYSFTSKR